MPLKFSTSLKSFETTQSSQLVWKCVPQGRHGCKDRLDQSRTQVKIVKGSCCYFLLLLFILLYFIFLRMEDFLCFAETYLVCDFQKIAFRWTVNIVVFWRGRRFLEEVTFTDRILYVFAGCAGWTRAIY